HGLLLALVRLRLLLGPLVLASQFLELGLLLVLLSVPRVQPLQFALDGQLFRALLLLLLLPETLPLALRRAASRDDHGGDEERALHLAPSVRRRVARRLEKRRGERARARSPRGVRSNVLPATGRDPSRLPARA